MNNYKLKVIGVWLGVMLGIIVLGWLLEYNDILQTQFFGPRREAVRRAVFEQTKSYNQGMIQELQNMQFQYNQADPGHQDALASIILHRAADYDETKLPPDLKEFIDTLRIKENVRR